MVDIAQLVSASDCGSEGRGFESHYPPQKKRSTPNGVLFFWNGWWDSNHLTATVQWTVACRRSRRRQLLTLCPEGTMAPNPIIHPRKETRLDTFFKSGISFLCWNNTQNRALFQLFSLYWFWRRHEAAPILQLGQESEKAIVHGIGIVQPLEFLQIPHN